MRVRLGLVSIMGVVLAASTAATARSSQVDRIWVDQFEARIDLADTLRSSGETAIAGLQPLASYARFYRFDTNTQGSALTAEYMIPFLTGIASIDGDMAKASAPGVHIGSPPVTIDDGGCSVISLRIEYPSGRVLSARCNGLA